jgi:predicted amidohydrolase YtcJ
MVTRRDAHGALIGDGEQVTVQEALRAYTTEAARAVGKEGILGILRAGAQADLAVLGGDPRAVPSAEIGAIEVRETWVAGVSVG